MYEFIFSTEVQTTTTEDKEEGTEEKVVKEEFKVESDPVQEYLTDAVKEED